MRQYRIFSRLTVGRQDTPECGSSRVFSGLPVGRIRLNVAVPDFSKGSHVGDVFLGRPVGEDLSAIE